MNKSNYLDVTDNEVKDINPYQSKDRRLVTQPYDMSVNTVVEQIKNGDIILGPEYQREYRWDRIKASRFIESLLLNIPIPTIFLAEEEDINYSVIDGQQRLTTIYNFIAREDTENGLVLEGLQIRSDLNGKKFSQLDKKDQGKLIKQYIRCIVILNDSDPQIKFDVFERLNTGSTQLSEQEIRNCIYRGPFNDILKNLAENKKFQEMLNLDEKHKNDMTSAEYVLRFLAYKYNIKNYTGSIKEFLNDFMREHRQDKNNQEEYTNIFNDTIDRIYEVLGTNAFRRYLNQRESWHNVLNKAVYDAQMIAFSNIKNNFNRSQNKKLRDEIIKLMDDEEFIRTIASSTNSISKVNRRIELIENCIKKIEVE